MDIANLITRGGAAAVGVRTIRSVFRVAAILAALALWQAEAHAQSQSSVRSDGTVIRNGKPFFPLGFYEVSSTELATIAAAGFNTAHVANRSGAAAYQAVLDEAARLGVGIIGACGSEDVLSCGLVDAYREHPGLLAWDVEDDADDEATRASSGRYVRPRLSSLVAALESF